MARMIPLTTTTTATVVKAMTVPAMASSPRAARPPVSTAVRSRVAGTPPAAVAATATTNAPTQIRQLRNASANTSRITGRSST